MVCRADGLAHRGRVERGEGPGVSVRREGTVHQVLGDGGKEPGLEGVLHRARSRGLRYDVMARVVWAEGAGQVLGTEEGEAVSYREDCRLTMQVGDGGHFVSPCGRPECCVLYCLKFGY